MLRRLREARKNEKGFSLVELIVVVAIIAILAAVIAPNAISQIEKSRVSNVAATANGLKTALVLVDADGDSADIKVSKTSPLKTKLHADGEAALSKHMDNLPGQHPWNDDYEIHVVGSAVYLVLIDLITDNPSAAAALVASEGFPAGTVVEAIIDERGGKEELVITDSSPTHTAIKVK